MINSNEHGNGTALFTRSGPAARKFQNEVEVGMVSCCSVSFCSPVGSDRLLPCNEFVPHPGCVSTASERLRCCAGGHQCAHPSPPTILLLHRLAGLLPRRPAHVWQGRRAVLHSGAVPCLTTLVAHSMHAGQSDLTSFVLVKGFLPRGRMPDCVCSLKWLGADLSVAVLSCLPIAALCNKVLIVSQFIG